MGQEAQLGAPLGGALGGGLGLRPASGGAPAAPTVQLLLVGGGGPGDRAPGAVSRGTGGGGGGQVVEVEITSPAIGSYPVTIGLGGVMAWDAYVPAGVTRFGSLLTAAPGGAPNNGTVGSSLEDLFLAGFNSAGLGATRSSYPALLAFGGFEGGAHFSSPRGGGGGGGAGGAGGNATSTAGGAPGPGKISRISGSDVEYGRGGTGGHATGGAGPNPINPGDGGSGAVPGSSTGGSNGNAGILILRYLTGTQTWTGGTITTVGPWTIHTCTADTTLTRTA